MKAKHICLIQCGLQVMLVIASGAKIQLFKDQDSSDLLWEVNVTNSECVNFPDDKILDLRSIITDTCFIAFAYSDCRPKTSYKYMPGKTFTHSKYLGLTNRMKSLHLCNDQEGGPQLNLYLTTFIDHQNPFTIPNVLESYDNVCTCVSIPKYVQDMSKWSIDNHGNGLYAYFEPNCKETNRHLRALYIEAGLWFDSAEMNAHKRNHRGTRYTVRSLGPDLNSTYFQLSCSAHRHDKIMQLELLETLNSAIPEFDDFPNETRIELTSGANDDPLHFFADAEFQGYHFGSRSTSKCNNFPKPVERRWVNGIGSIKTKTCVILYSAYDCMERSVKIEAPGNSNLTSVWELTVSGERTLSLLYTQYPKWKWETKSYRVCDNEEGGDILNVDIISNDPTVEPISGPVVLESYPNFCLCRNVPEYVQELDKWFINNHGNSMVAYFSHDCSSITYAPLWIPAGQSSYSFGLGSFKNVALNTGIIHKIKSLGPDPNAGYFHKNCNNDFKSLSTFGQGNSTGVNSGRICDSHIVSESTLVGMLYMQIVSELKHISKKVDELKRINQQTGLNFENVKSFFEGKLQNQKDEFKNLTSKIRDDLNDLFA